MKIFSYGKTEIEHLKRCDRKLREAIDRLGIIEREVNLEPFTALIKSIVSQQISRKAADTVWARLCERFGAVSAANIAASDIAGLQTCGLSGRKAEYVKGIGSAVQSGEIDFSLLTGMTDEDVIGKLSSLRGVGVWTAEMFLIFSLCRPDVVSWGDLAIRRGMMNLYGLKTLPKEDFERYRRRYSPYGSVASLYLWALSHDGDVEK
jgi:DNA-3-methyladenine glycosylase II